MAPPRVVALVLAAGNSSRLGRNKQLVEVAGEPLVRRAVRSALAAGAARVVVVTGFAPAAVAAAVSGLACEVAPASQWALGMGASLQAGVAHALATQPAPDALLVVLPDQALLGAAHFAKLLARLLGPSGRETIVATRYGAIVGAPVAFGPAHFPELLSLAPDAGAKQLLQRHAGAVVAVDEAAAAVDVDTPADLAALRRMLPE